MFNLMTSVAHDGKYKKQVKMKTHLKCRLKPILVYFAIRVKEFWNVLIFPRSFSFKINSSVIGRYRTPIPILAS